MDYIYLHLVSELEVVRSKFNVRRDIITIVTGYPGDCSVTRIGNHYELEILGVR